MIARRRRGLAAVALCGLAGLLPACGAPRVALPSGSGTPFPDFQVAYDSAASGCAGLSAMTASLAVSGRVGATKLRGRIDAGLARPAQIRLEGFPPMMFGGRPYFTLVSRGASATLYLPRAGQVLRDAPPADVIDALAGVRLDADELRAVLGACGFGVAPLTAGRQYADGWAAVDAGTTTITTTYLRRVSGAWTIAGATRVPVTVEYSDVASGRPRVVRLRSAPPGGDAVDIVLRLSQVEIGAPIDSRAFELSVPADARPIGLADVRKLGPLGGGS